MMSIVEHTKATCALHALLDSSFQWMVLANKLAHSARQVATQLELAHHATKGMNYLAKIALKQQAEIQIAKLSILPPKTIAPNAIQDLLQ